MHHQTRASNPDLAIKTAPKLNAAATAGDVAAIETAFGDVGKSCKNCHRQFRAKERD